MDLQTKIIMPSMHYITSEPIAIPAEDSRVSLDLKTRNRLQAIFTDMNIPSQCDCDVPIDQIITFVEEVKPVSLNVWGIHFSDHQMYILLSLCKNVERLTIDFSFNRDPRLAAELSQLTQLRHLSLNRFCSHLSFDLSKLTKLESLSTTGAIDKEPKLTMPDCPNLKSISYSGNDDILDLTNYTQLDVVTVSATKVVFPVSMPSLKKVVMVTKELNIVLPAEAPLLEHVEIFEDIEEPRKITWPADAPNLNVKLIDVHASLLKFKK